MATKFSSIFKQELKSRGALESLGSTVVKSMAERVDLRNVLFGGKGFVAKTGRRIFGKGYDPIDRARRITPDSSAAIAAVASLQDSNKRQEDALKIIVKNTMNMNMMARDMNITRQNIASITKSMTGKSSKGADALWMNAERRNKLISGGTDRSNMLSPTKTSGSTGSILSGVLGGVMGIGGSIGSGIFRALGSIIAISPILGIVGIAAAGYAIKKMGESIDFSGIFNSIKTNILNFLGIDPKSDTPIMKQLAARLDGIFSTDKFTSIYDWVGKNFGEDFKKIGKMISDTTKEIMIYSESAFRVLGNGFAKLGEIFAFHFGQFINQYKPELLATLGASIGASVGSIFGIKGAALGGLIGAGAGYIMSKVTGSRTEEDVQSDIEKSKAQREELLRQIQIEEGKLPSKKEGQEYKQRFEKIQGMRRELLSVEDRIGIYGEELIQGKEKVESLRLNMKNLGFTGENYTQQLEEVRKKYESSTSPERISSPTEMAALIYKKFTEKGYSDIQAKAAIINAMAESNLNPYAQNSTGKEESYGLFQINRKAHPSFSKGQLLNPEGNIDAILKIMETDYKKYGAEFKTLNNLDEATKYFMTHIERPRLSAEETEKRLSLMNKIPAGSVDLGSRMLAESYRSGGEQSAPVIQNINNNNVTKAAPQSQQVPGAFNHEITELLMGLAIGR